MPYSHPESRLRTSLRAALPSALWTAMRRLRLNWTLATFRKRIVQHTYAGFPMKLEIPDPMAEGWYDRDWLEPPAIGLLRRHGLREGALVFNIGAHQGLIALMLARNVGPSGRVVAVEAMSFNVEAAARNRDLNGASQITVVHAAGAEKSGMLHFNPTFNAAMDPKTGATGKISVKAVTVDELAAEYGTPDVLFIDVEGYECHVMKGAARTLESKPDVVIEAHVGCGLERFGGSIEDLLKFFPPEAFATWMAADEKSSEQEEGCWPLERTDPMLGDLFQLVAIGRRRPAGNV